MKTNDSEASIQQQIQIGWSKRGDRLFRNNNGTGWQGETTRLADGSILIRNPRPLRAGLVVGSGDLIGWKQIQITPEMVGQTVAIFANVEVKSLKGRATTEQIAFDKTVKDNGGVSGIVRSLDESLKL